ncbi:MAG: nucleotidyltransferase domain-containing protein [Methylococcales bacterium]
MDGFYARDFLETSEGLIFAVVINGADESGVYCFLRYVDEDDRYRKVTTPEANTRIERYHPEYLFYAKQWDTYLHKIPLDRIQNHFRPRERLQVLLESDPADNVEASLIDLLHMLEKRQIDLGSLGVTGSILIGAHSEKSDIDLVVYDRKEFHGLRNIVKSLIVENKLQALDDNFWFSTYERRGCALGLSEYIWHERRKYNKAVINGVKFDISFVDTKMIPDMTPYRKSGKTVLVSTITDDQWAFDCPARYFVSDDKIKEVVSFTPTYVGQGRKDEQIEAAGWLEVSESGQQRLVIGSSREATGEYIKVVNQFPENKNEEKFV